MQPNEPNDGWGRRHFLRSGLGLGTAALANLFDSGQAFAVPHHGPRAKSIIYLFMHGGPSQLELFDHKPKLSQWHGQEIPASVRGTQRLTGMTSGQGSLPLVSSRFRFAQRGGGGLWMSELLPHLAGVADELCIVRSMHTEAINHDPAVTLMQSGHQQPGRPSLGAWLSYGLGSENQNLPAFVVLMSRGSAARPADPLHARLWGAEFLPSQHQGTQFRSDGEPVLYLRNPPGLSESSRRRTLERLAALNRLRREETGDPEIEARIAQYEKAFRMQSAVPELTDLKTEPTRVRELYGPDAGKPGTFATNCLLARRLVESGVRFVQLYHRGWDQHYNLGNALREQGNLEEAIACLRKALELDAKLAFAHNNLGKALQAQGKLDEAIACYRQALQLDPKYATAQRNLDIALREQKRRNGR